MNISPCLASLKAHKLNRRKKLDKARQKSWLKVKTHRHAQSRICAKVLRKSERGESASKKGKTKEEKHRNRQRKTFSQAGSLSTKGRRQKAPVSQETGESWQA